jgi:PKD repeat protein
MSSYVTIAAMVHESPLMGDSAMLSARVGPLARFEAQSVSGIAPHNVALTNTSIGEIDSWLWYFGDGATSSLPNPTHDYSRPGIYSVTLEVEGPDGSDSTTRANLIRVRQELYLPLILRNYR